MQYNIINGQWLYVCVLLWLNGEWYLLMMIQHSNPMVFCIQIWSDDDMMMIFPSAMILTPIDDDIIDDDDDGSDE